jgi:putative holliday junction resolvase
MRILGIDYGEKRVGVAITDDKSMMAFPHSVVVNTKELVKEISDIARENKISTIVIGESRNYKGEANRIMERVEIFAKGLKESGFEVVYEPEILSSHQAAHFQGKTDKLDASAASIILQSYLDRVRSA